MRFFVFFTMFVTLLISKCSTKVLQCHKREVNGDVSTILVQHDILAAAVRKRGSGG